MQVQYRPRRLEGLILNKHIGEHLSQLVGSKHVALSMLPCLEKAEISRNAVPLS